MSPNADRSAGRLVDESWRPVCPGCGYALEGLPDGRCPECGRRFSIAQLREAASHRNVSLLSEARAAAVLRITGWTVVLAVPMCIAVQGGLLAVRSGIELARGCHWSDTWYNSAWTPQTTIAPTAREAFSAGILWLLFGLALSGTVYAVVRCAVWALMRLGIEPYRYTDGTGRPPDTGSP